MQWANGGTDSTFSQNRTVSTILIDQTKTFARNDGNDICRYKTAQSVKCRVGIYRTTRLRTLSDFKMINKLVVNAQFVESIFPIL